MNNHKNNTHFPKKIKMLFKLSGLVLAIIFSSAFGGDQNRISNGEDASEEQFPYQVSLQHKNFGHQCGGSILNKKWILTAAHCVNGSSISDWRIYMGSVLLSSGGTYHKPTRIIVHGEYKKAPHIMVKNDVAVIELENEIEFSNRVKKIELETEVVDEIDCVASGWGFLKDNSRPDHLQYINMKTVSFETCHSYFHDVVDDKKEICTLVKFGKYCKSSDSGGPVVANGKQIGIVSWGPIDVGDNVVTANVHARISTYAEWINKAIHS